jgi:hypothetical protein
LCCRDNIFGFAQKDVDGYLKLEIERLSGAMTFLFVMEKNWCRALLNLCISDASKGMLLGNDGFIPHLVSPHAANPPL